MKKVSFLLGVFLFNLIFSSHLSNNNNNNFYHNVLRNLWEEDVSYPSGRTSEEETSLNRCTKSSYKYFSNFVSGEPVEYSHSSSYGSGSVSNIKLYIFLKI